MSKSNSKIDSDWFSNPNIRPKAVVVIYTRTRNGYVMHSADVINLINQHAAEAVEVPDLEMFLDDLELKGTYFDPAAPRPVVIERHLRPTH